MTEKERDERNLKPHGAATFARIHWGERYSKQNGGSMDFWDSLTHAEKRFCCEALAQIKRSRT